MKKLILILLLIPLFFSCSENKTNKEKAQDLFFEGTLYLSAGKIEESINLFDKAIVLDSIFPKPILQRGIANIEINNFAEAIIDLNNAISLINVVDSDISKNNSNDSENTLSLLLAEDNIKIELSESYVTELVDSYYWRGYAKLYVKDYNGANYDFSKAIDLDPEIAEAYYYRGVAKLKLGENYNYCDDWLVAVERGDKESTELIKKYCIQN